MKNEVEATKSHYKILTEGVGHPAPKGAAFGMLNQLTQQLLTFETTCVELGMRRVFVMSQALSIIVNAVISKIELIAEGAIPDEIARQWANYGILLYFEGLLSTGGKERGMLEDTRVALLAVSQYSVRICDKQQLQDQLSYHDLETFGTSVLVEGADVFIRGRECLVALPTETLELLPSFLQNELSLSSLRKA